MKHLLCLFLLAAALDVSAQTSTNDLLSHVPADADQVIHVNLQAIGSKIDLPGLINLIGSQSKGKRSGAIFQQFLGSGLDMHQDLIVAQTNTNHPDSIKYTTVIAHITDSAKFVAFMHTIANQDGKPLHIIHPSGYAKERVALYGEDADAWSDKLVVMTFFTLPKSSTSAEPQPGVALKAAHRAAAALHGFFNTPFITNSHITGAFSDDADVHLWNLHGQFSSLFKKLSHMPGMNMDQLQGMSQIMAKSKILGESVAELRFDNGKISFRTLKYFDAGQLAATQRMLGQGLSGELLAIVPPKQLLGVATLHWDMAAFEDTLKKNPSAGMMDSLLRSKGISIDDFFHALKGDFMFLACTPEKPSANDSAPPTKLPTPVLYLVASITDKAAFEKVATALNLKNVLTPGSDTTVTDTARHKLFSYYLIQNDLVVLGKRRQIQAFFTPGTTLDPVGKLLPEQPQKDMFNIGLDIHGFLTTVLAGMMNAPGSGAGGPMSAIQEIKTLQVSSGSIHDDAVETRIELIVGDPDKNSLTTIITLLSALGGKH